MPLWDGQNWQWWVKAPPAGLIKIRPVEAMQVHYVAKLQAAPDDLLVPFVETMWQHLSYSDVCPLTSAISDSFEKMGTVVRKLQHTFTSRGVLGSHLASEFASTEMEYLLVLARTVFDLVQEAIARIWNRHVQLLDPEAERQRKQKGLVETFSKVVLVDKTRPRSAEEIESKFGLPPLLASTYAQITPFFMQLRDARERVVHAGASLGLVYCTERGFCAHRESKAFRGYDGWSDAHRYNETLVSILPWIADLVLRTIGACNALINAFAETIRLPPPLAPGYRVFVRGPCTAALMHVLRVFEGASPWWSEGQEENDALGFEQRVRERAYFLSQHRTSGSDATADWLAAEQIERG